MLYKSISVLLLSYLLLLTGCASVPMASVDADQSVKEFNAPSEDTAGLYIYRNSFAGSALKKTLYIDGEIIGESASKTYFYREVKPGKHTLSTESEFSPNDLIIYAEEGKNHYIKQSIKIGLFVGGAKLTLVSEEEGKKGVLECKLAN